MDGIDKLPFTCFTIGEQKSEVLCIMTAFLTGEVRARVFGTSPYLAWRGLKWGTTPIAAPLQVSFATQPQPSKCCTLSLTKPPWQFLFWARATTTVPPTTATHPFHPPHPLCHHHTPLSFHLSTASLATDTPIQSTQAVADVDLSLYTLVPFYYRYNIYTSPPSAT